MEVITHSFWPDPLGGNCHFKAQETVLQRRCNARARRVRFRLVFGPILAAPLASMRPFPAIARAARSGPIRSRLAIAGRASARPRQDAP